VRTPEANIRVDLLLIWLALLIVSIWFAIRVFKMKRGCEAPTLSG